MLYETSLVYLEHKIPFHNHCKNIVNRQTRSLLKKLNKTFDSLNENFNSLYETLNYTLKAILLAIKSFHSCTFYGTFTNKKLKLLK